MTNIGTAILGATAVPTNNELGWALLIAVIIAIAVIFALGFLMHWGDGRDIDGFAPPMPDRDVRETPPNCGVRTVSPQPAPTKDADAATETDWASYGLSPN